MTAKERVIAALRHEEPDRVPLMEFCVDYTLLEDLLGRPTFWRAKLKELQAYWDGGRDEVVASQKRDIVDFAREFGQDGVALNLVPPKGFLPEKLQQLDHETWRDWRGNLYRYSALTHDLMLFQYEALDPQPAPDLWEAPAEVDESEWELVDHVVQELGATHYLMARPGRRTACSYPSALSWEPMMMRLAEEPEKVAEERLRWARATDYTMYLERGCDNVALGEDFGHNHGPFMSPRCFHEVYVPSIRVICDWLHNHGLPVLWHACGDNRLILDQMIEAGIDCYQAIQPEEDIVGLRRTWGHQLALWGGFSTHSMVMDGPEELRRQVRETIRGCGPGGGLVLGASHSLTVSAKPENYLAVLDELNKVGVYPLA